MEELISIIVPVYNVEKYIKRCLESIQKQTYSNWECLIVNDGSTDHSEQIARYYTIQDRRFRLIIQENRGLSAARNRGIEESKGNYLTFVDSDDCLDKKFLKTLYGMLKRDKSEISVCHYCKFHTELSQGIKNRKRKKEREQTHTVISPYHAIQDVLQYRKRFMISAWGKLYKRKLFDSIQYPEGKLHEDEFTTYHLYAQCKKISVSEVPLYYYFQRDSSIMGTYRIQRLDILEAFYQSVLFTKKNMPKLYPAAYMNYLFNLTVAYYRVSSIDGEEWILRLLRQEFLNTYRKYKQNMLHISDYSKRKRWKNSCPFIKRAAMKIFQISPIFFNIGAKIYIKRLGYE